MQDSETCTSGEKLETDDANVAVETSEQTTAHSIENKDTTESVSESIMNAEDASNIESNIKADVPTEDKVSKSSAVKGCVMSSEDLEPGEITFIGHASEVETSVPKPEKKYYKKFLFSPTGDHIWRCAFPKCGMCFDTKEGAKFHNSVHTGKENPNYIECKSCTFKVPFSKWYELLRHMKENHYICITYERFGCFFCGLNFESEEKLVSHMDFHYSSKYKCIHCGKIFFTWKQIEKHLDDCEAKALGKLIVGCPYCTFIFHIRNVRNVHLLSHTDEGLQCAICQDNEQWEQWKLLRKHYQTKHVKVLSNKIGPFRDKLPHKRRPPKCPSCKEDFKNQEQFAYHMKRVHDWIPYTLFGCVKCERSFKSQASHDRHFKNAHGFEIKCDKCDYIGKNTAMMK